MNSDGLFLFFTVSHSSCSINPHSTHSPWPELMTHWTSSRWGDGDDYHFSSSNWLPFVQSEFVYLLVSMTYPLYYMTCHQLRSAVHRVVKVRSKRIWGRNFTSLATLHFAPCAHMESSDCSPVSWFENVFIVLLQSSSVSQFGKDVCMARSIHYHVHCFYFTRLLTQRCVQPFCANSLIYIFVYFIQNELCMYINMN